MRLERVVRCEKGVVVTSSEVVIVTHHLIRNNVPMAQLDRYKIFTSFAVSKAKAI